MQLRIRDNIDKELQIALMTDDTRLLKEEQIKKKKKKESRGSRGGESTYDQDEIGIWEYYHL